MTLSAFPYDICLGGGKKRLRVSFSFTAAHRKRQIVYFTSAMQRFITFAGGQRGRAVRVPASPFSSLSSSSLDGPKTLFDKIWASHVVGSVEGAGDANIIYIDRHLVHEVTSPQAFEGLSIAGRKVRRPECTLVTPDHNVPTTSDRLEGNFVDEMSKIQVHTLEDNVKRFGLENSYFPLSDNRQGIVHIVGPEQGFTLPGLTIVCGDSHTATHGAFGALAFGIGTSEVEHVLATQTLVQQPAKNMRISVEGDLLRGVTSKDLILHIIGVIGTAGGNGHVIEYSGKAIRGLSMEARMTICNMSIEAGARAGLIAPDTTTFEYLRGRPLAPSGETWEKAVQYWETLPSDEGAQYDTEHTVRGADIAPQVTWGTNPEMVSPITGVVPDPDSQIDPAAARRALDYMGLESGQSLDGLAIDRVFVGSCTNGRMEDLRALEEVTRGHSVKDGLNAMVVPGSGLVKMQAEDEGILSALADRGFDVREPGCSMCLGMNADQLQPYERCASTSNRNFESRQGKLGRTHLVSPAMAGVAAITGKLTDVRNFVGGRSFSTAASGSAPEAFQPFTVHEGIPAPLPQPNIDTDMIIPARFLKTIKRTGLGIHAFDEMRYDDDGKERPDFILNQEAFRTSSILVVGDNFGCGSSREHAPWSLLDHGIRCIISTSFADIFFNNCFKNGILPIVLSEKDVATLMDDAQLVPTLGGLSPSMSVDLNTQIITRVDGRGTIAFEVDPFRRHCLMNGLDDIALTLQQESAISEFEQSRKECMPWI